jgi:hypothetical protein
MKVKQLNSLKLFVLKVKKIIHKQFKSDIKEKHQTIKNFKNKLLLKTKKRVFINIESASGKSLQNKISLQQQNSFRKSKLTCCCYYHNDHKVSF